MALDIQREHEAGTARGRFYEIPERLYKTKDDRIVPQGDPEANSLFKPAGASIPMKEAIRLGLVPEEESVKDKPAAKQAAKAKNKMAKKPANKAKGGK